VPLIWRNALNMTFIDLDNNELAHVSDTDFVPRVGENVRLADVPYVVERVGYDVPGKTVDRVWVVCRPV
jgi:hypothetical protein